MAGKRGPGAKPKSTSRASLLSRNPPGGVWPRYANRSSTGTPSISQEMIGSADSMSKFASARTSSTVLPNSGAKEITLKIGKKNALMPWSDTVHSRTVVPPKLPSRNHTFPPWSPRSHNAPVSSNNGFSAAGNCRTHSHQSLAHWPYVWPKALRPGSAIVTPGGPPILLTSRS